MSNNYRFQDSHFEKNYFHVQAPIPWHEDFFLQLQYVIDSSGIFNFQWYSESDEEKKYFWQLEFFSFLHFRAWKILIVGSLFLYVKSLL